jgi:putative endonuclease
VAGFLRAGGYDVLGRRVRAGQGEVDLVVTRDDTVAFVEVKARRKGYEGLEAVTPRKQARIGAAASAWLSRNPQYAGHTIRFDVALVWPGSRLDYLENAFELAGSEDCVW